MHKKQALRYTQRLDALANDVQENWKAYGLTKQAAYDFCFQVDKMSDRIDEIAGIDRQSEEHLDLRDEHDRAGEHPAGKNDRDFMDHREPDEPYMDHYDMEGVLEGLDPEDGYMGEFSHSEDAGFKDGPLEGEDPLEGHKRRQRASQNNWYDRSASSRNTGGSWYDRSSARQISHGDMVEYSSPRGDTFTGVVESIDENMAGETYYQIKTDRGERRNVNPEKGGTIRKVSSRKTTSSARNWYDQ